MGGANSVSGGFSQMWDAIKYAVRGDATPPRLDALKTSGQAAGGSAMGCSCGSESIQGLVASVAPTTDGGPGEVTDFTPPPPPDGGPGADGSTGLPPPVVVSSDAGPDTPPPPADAGPGAIPTEHPHIVTAGCPDQCPNRNELAIQAGPLNPRYSRILLFGEAPAVCNIGDRFDGVVGGENQSIPGAVVSCATLVGTQASYAYSSLVPLLDSNEIFLCADREGDETPPPSYETRVLTYRGAATIGDNLVFSSDHGLISVIHPQTGETLQVINLWQAGWNQANLPSDINDCRTPPTLGGGTYFDADQSTLYVVFENKDLKRDPFFLFGAERSLLAIPYEDGRLVEDKSRYQLIDVGRGAVGIAGLGDGEKVVLRLGEDSGQGRPASIVHVGADNRVISEIPLTDFTNRISSDNTQLVVPPGTRTVLLKTVGLPGEVVVVNVDEQTASSIDTFGDVTDMGNATVSDITCFDLQPVDGLSDGCYVSLSTGLEQFIDPNGVKGARFVISGSPVLTGVEAKDCGDGQGGCVVKLTSAMGVFIYP